MSDMSEYISRLYTLGWEFGVKIISAKKNEQTSQITVIKPRKNNILNI